MIYDSYENLELWVMFFFWGRKPLKQLPESLLVQLKLRWTVGHSLSEDVPADEDVPKAGSVL